MFDDLHGEDHEILAPALVGFRRLSIMAWIQN